MTEIQLDNDVPVPSTSPRPTLYPFRDMEVGQSFFVPNKTPVQLSSSKAYATRRTGFRFICRTVTDWDVKGTRVWRIK